MSGTPDLTLILNTPGVIEDVSFHPCVRLARWERESVVSFVPPDGAFTLMTYRVVDRSPALPIVCKPIVSWRDGVGRASFSLISRPMPMASGGARSSLAGVEGGVEDVKVVITFPKAIKSHDLSTDVGSVSVDPRSSELTWALRSAPRDKSPELSGTLFVAPGAASPLEAVSATLSFAAPGQSASGLNVKDLLLVSEKYPFFKGVRTILKSGRVQLRT